MTATHAKPARKPWHSHPAIKTDEHLAYMLGADDAATSSGADEYVVTPTGQAIYPELEKRLGAAAAVSKLVAMGEAKHVKAATPSDPQHARINAELKALPPATRRATIRAAIEEARSADAPDVTAPDYKTARKAELKLHVEAANRMRGQPTMTAEEVERLSRLAAHAEPLRQMAKTQAKTLTPAEAAARKAREAELSSMVRGLQQQRRG